MRGFLTQTLIAVVLSVAGGCATQQSGDGTCDLAAPACGSSLVCDAVVDGEPRCALPVRIAGIVLDATTDEPIAGALVQAVDVNGAAVGTSAETDADGRYLLTVPSTRDADGTPTDGTYTLRAQAALYQAFPTAIRPALPMDATTALSEDAGWTSENALTTIALLPLPGDTSQLGTISGVIDATLKAGLLVVAEANGVGYTGFSDADGSYTIFNAPAGNYTVNAYAAGVQIDATAATVTAGEEITEVDLVESDAPLSTISGSVQIVNAPGGLSTSVVLALESTFVEAAGRGEVPSGLRVGGILGVFTITDVPDGNYVVLAAFENDQLVRDPDQTIGGTKTVRIEVPDADGSTDITLPEGFKVTEALAVVTPGADGPEEITTATPTFEWADDSSEDGYELRVFDAFGDLIWSTEMPSVSGSVTVTYTYDGPALESGMFYQFKATSFRDKNGVRTNISSTEDLKGVFQYVSG